MPSQIATYANMAAVNQLSGTQTLTAGAVGPTWTPGVVYYSTGTSSFQTWTGSAWSNVGAVGGVIGPQQRYLALLTQDPIANNVVNLSDAGFVECSTSGYSRSQVIFNAASQSYPSTTSNNAVITWTFSSTMTTAVQWVALVTTSTGTAGLFLASWLMNTAYAVDASQSIQLGIGQLILQGN